ncbi:hypothetical protein CAPN001_22060 [Capnocytophaga stomatis]|uniref:glycosyltransferase family 4 protein n=1 Tax=Capnocytophaga stomatis TaxID=1848904 RepID=UPI00194FBD65|nr:glycosyltransferase family 4 protein [Capnocytophaga stomatis]GIJ97637.1 hypothetical protein CAPN001_22060 [Capnocytophaga stomatis]
MKIFGVKNVLLVTGKFPGTSSDTDGGSIMVNHLIDALRGVCTVDVLFTRTYNAHFNNINGVRKVIFHTNKFRESNKFLRRIANSKWNSELISQFIPQYDKVIIIHCSKAFGLENLPKELLKKIILFPMYLTSSYRRSNEIVPDEYVEAEQRILSKIEKIISPSQSEKKDTINEYGIYEKHIVVIPRATNLYIKGKVRYQSKTNKLIYIGAIRQQKRNDDAIILLSKLKQKNENFHLYLVGAIQDETLYSHCIDLAFELGVKNNISFCGVLSQKEIAELLNDVDINISVSRWETFGRGIFEGLSAGLPTVVYDNIDCLSEYIESGEGISYVKNVDDMAQKVYDLCTNPYFYRDQSQKAIESTSQFSIENQKEKLLEEILYLKR